MKMAEIRFLERDEQPKLPKWAGILPKTWRKGYIERKKPYRIQVEEEKITAILQTTAENSIEPVWRRNAAALLQSLKAEGVAVVIPPIEGEMRWDILPLATGKRLTNLFAFAGAAEALRRMGKPPEECQYLLAGGDGESWRSALVSMGNEVNRLAIFTEQPEQAEPLVQELLEEWGLMAEVFSSPKNPVMGQADVVLCCGIEQFCYEHMLKERAVFIDLAGNRPILRRLMEKRPDMVVADGFFFRQGEAQTEGRYAEGELFCSSSIFREKGRFPLEKEQGERLLAECRKKGYALSGFSLMGKRVKIHRKP